MATSPEYFSWGQPLMCSLQKFSVNVTPSTLSQQQRKCYLCYWQNWQKCVCTYKCGAELFFFAIWFWWNSSDNNIRNRSDVTHLPRYHHRWILRRLDRNWLFPLRNITVALGRKKASKSVFCIVATRSVIGASLKNRTGSTPAIGN